MPGYLMLFPLLGAGVAVSLVVGHRLTRLWLGVTAASLALSVTAVIALAHLPWPPIAAETNAMRRYPLEEAIDWTDVVTALQTRGMLGSPRLLIAGTRWHEAGKIDYALRGQMSVICLCRDARGYGLLPRPADWLGANVVIVGRNLSTDMVKSMYAANFEGIEELASITIKHAGAPTFDLSVYLGRGLRSQVF
jgi:hypothetical protein